MTHAERLIRCRRYGRVSTEALRALVRAEGERAVQLDPLATTRHHLFRSPVNQPRKARPLRPGVVASRRP